MRSVVHLALSSGIAPAAWLAEDPWTLEYALEAMAEAQDDDE